jgi:endonuclease YncB( thermonuclease family)
LTVGGQPVPLYGIGFLPSLTDVTGQSLAGWIASQKSLTCDPRPGGTYRCLTDTNLDVAEAALLNGAASASPDAPSNYLAAQQAAQQARRGLWQK